MDMTLSRRLRLVGLMCLLVATVGCDQTSKHIARTTLSRESSVTLKGGILELRLAENPGSFLSMGELLPDRTRFAIFTIGIGVGLVALAGYLIGHARIDAPRFIGLSLVMAGGIGNLLDRVLRHGLVTDFAVIHVGPVHTGVFNIADVLIVVGIGCTLITLRRGEPMAQHTDRER